MDWRTSSRYAYSILLALQIAGAAVLTWIALPEFRRLLVHLGEQLRAPFKNDLVLLTAVVIMQAAYWFRLLRLPLITFQKSRLFASHLFHFFSRISFIFGSAVFSLVFFRHVPELGPGTDALLLVWRAVLLSGSLFALFCLSLELDRFADALAAGGSRKP
jgi:hypothetical protein